MANIVYLRNGVDPICYQTKPVGFSEARLKKDAIAEISDKLKIPVHRLVAKGKSDIRSKQLCCTWEDQVFEAKVQQDNLEQYGLSALED